MLQRISQLLKKNLLLSFVGVFILGGAVSFVISEKRINKDCVLNINSGSEVSTDTNAKIFVDLSGAVNKPGLYEIEKDGRVGDLLVLGSGVSHEASAGWISKNLNLSKKLNDSSKLYIPFEWEVYSPEGYDISNTENTSVDNNSNSGAENDDSDSDTDGNNNDSEDNEGDTGEIDSGKINVNTASSSELDTLPGIGPANAEKIITNRPYTNISDFESKSGLYKSTVEGIKNLISF